MHRDDSPSANYHSLDKPVQSSKSFVKILPAFQPVVANGILTETNLSLEEASAV